MPIFFQPRDSLHLGRMGTVPLRDVIRARDRRRHELRAVLQDRQRTVDELLQFKRGSVLKAIHEDVFCVFKRAEIDLRPSCIMARDGLNDPLRYLV
jgi:hypothetical protein